MNAYADHLMIAIHSDPKTQMPHGHMSGMTDCQPGLQFLVMEGHGSDNAQYSGSVKMIKAR